ncbi:DUF6232 family protein [Streptomyces sp. CL12]|uniref:DUF6232 family protein n=1 Tax=Streptomyces sp. CL12 TaxID=3391744 RepID=UPI003A812F92
MDRNGSTGPPMPSSPPPSEGVDLRVGKRLLWVGEAAYPLHNLVRVYTAEFKPKRWEAFWHFVIGGAIGLLVAHGMPPLRLVGLVVAVGLFLRFLKVLSAPSKYVLAIDTSGAASALVTLPDRKELHRLVEAIVEAVENPDKELQVRVDTVQFNRREYHQGDRVNVYGGLNNVGILKK